MFPVVDLNLSMCVFDDRVIFVMFGEFKMFVYYWKSCDPLSDVFSFVASVCSCCSVSRKLNSPSDVMFNLSISNFDLLIIFGYFSA